MNEFILHVDFCLTPLEIIRDACILCRDGQIVAVGGASAFVGLEDIPEIRRLGCKAIPGLVDTHIHGFADCDFMDVDSQSDLSRLSLALATHGVTSILPTVITAEKAQMLAMMRNLSAQCHDEHAGAVPVGVNLEGPFLNPQQCGAQDHPAVRPVDLEETRELLEAGAGKIRIMTFAPELERADALIKLLCDNKVIPSMGHTLADKDATLRAIDAGATRCTHFFNGMPSLNRRDVALTGTVLVDDRVTIELIADGIHVHPIMIDLACRAKPRNRVVGTSDAIKGATLGDGTYTLGAVTIEIVDGISRRMSDGRLSGTTLAMDQALRNLAHYSPSITELEAIACYSLNPALSIGLTDRGLIQPGKRADIAVLDATGQVVMTIVRGRIVFDRNATLAEPIGAPGGVNARPEPDANLNRESSPDPVG